MGWIANRIKAEHRKHKNLEWEMIAEIKIISSLKYLIDKAPDIDEKHLIIDALFVEKQLMEIVKNEDLSRYIL